MDCTSLDSDTMNGTISVHYNATTALSRRHPRNLADAQYKQPGFRRRHLPDALQKGAYHPSFRPVARCKARRGKAVNYDDHADHHHSLYYCLPRRHYRRNNEVPFQKEEMQESWK